MSNDYNQHKQYFINGGNMKRSNILFLILFFIVVNTGFAQMHHGRIPMRAKIMEELKLNDSQKEQFEKIKFETEKKNIDLKARIETSKLELHRLLTSDNPDKATIEKKFNDVAAIEVSMKMNLYNSWTDCNKILNPDQQKVWKKVLMMRLHQAQMQGHRFHKMPPPQMEHEQD